MQLSKEKPSVNVCMITYMHENYIKNSIEGVLSQKTNFPVELIIADDHSPDKTEEIVRNILNNSDSSVNVHYVRHKHNKGLFENFKWVIKKSKGKYIAFCEGDDNWSDPLKLQKQVEFLEANPNYSLCSHEAYYTHIHDPNSLRKLIAIFYHNFRLDGLKSIIKLLKLLLLDHSEFWNRRRKPSNIKRYSDADLKITLDTAMSSRYIPMLSIVARGEILRKIPNKLFDISAGHRLVILWSALHGKLRHFTDVMGFKNTQESSVTVTKIIKKTSTKKSRLDDTITMLNLFKKYSSPKKCRLIDKKINKLVN